jgi:hypothetical protein
MGEWARRPAFILAGGPSVDRLDLTRLSGQLVIAINSAWRSYPQADMLFYGDARWWRELGRKALGDNGEGFAGEIVTPAPERPKRASLRRKVSLRRQERDGLADNPREIAMRHSSVSGAINEAVHRSASAIFVLGLDGRTDADGRRHHHGEAYPWQLIKGCFDKHAAEFARIAPWLEQRGVQVFNVNPDSAIDVWPKISFDEALRMAPRRERIAA